MGKFIECGFEVVEEVDADELSGRLPARFPVSLARLRGGGGGGAPVGIVLYSSRVCVGVFRPETGLLLSIHLMGGRRTGA